MQRGHLPRFLGPALAAMIAAAAGAAAPSLAADSTDISANQRAEKRDFTDSQIFDGFFKTAFGAEYHLAGRVDRIRKFEGPVRIFAEGETHPDRRAQLARVVADIAKRIRHLDIAITEDSDEANVTVHLVRDRNLNKTIQTFYGAERAKEIRESLDPQCLSGFRKNDKFEIEHADVILTIDNGDFVFLDCAYEELLQSLGPINDTDQVPWTMFNDDVQKGYFDVYDQYLMNILYHPEIKPGMTVQEVKSVLPQVMADVRSFVGKVNGLGQ
ncbi:DUF2927 domain-containing protein [Rhodopseudomonas palustris]|uniref:DUF2927 domain-containing protein n=1 Tax=Rhodopseudomonas palustris TaxID=1076 RepID=UPI003CC81AF2